MKKMLLGNSIMLLGLAVAIIGDFGGATGPATWISIAVILFGFCKVLEGFTDKKSDKPPKGET